MQIAQLAHSAQSADVRAQRGHNARPRPRHGLATIAPLDIGAIAARSDQAFLALLAAYRASGGLARADEAATLLERRGLDGGQLARWRTGRRVVAFDWQSHFW